MRFITADCIFPVTSPPIPNGVLVIEDDGTILSVSGDTTTVPSSHDAEYFPGFLVPGFVNTHCHLELSHLKNKLVPGGGLPDFIRQVIAARKASEKEITDPAKAAELEMFNGGIKAVGDISNVADSFAVKFNSQMYWHTFIEVFDLSSQNASMEIEKANQLQSLFQSLKGSHPEAKNKNRVSITPHAPYTVSPALFGLIRENAGEFPGISIHNQETPGENELFDSGKGALIELLKNFGD